MSDNLGDPQETNDVEEEPPGSTPGATSSSVTVDSGTGNKYRRRSASVLSTVSGTGGSSGNNDNENSEIGTDSRLPSPSGGSTDSETEGRLEVNDNNTNQTGGAPHVDTVSHQAPPLGGNGEEANVQEAPQRNEVPKAQRNYEWLWVLPFFILVVGVMYSGDHRVVYDVTTSNAGNSRDAFLHELRAIKSNLFPSQDLDTWSVISSNVRSLFNLQQATPACVLLVGESASGQRAANCLAKKLAGAFQKSITGKSNADPEIFDSGQKSDLDDSDAKFRLFELLDLNLKTKHTFALLDIQKLPAEVAMALHGFCDESASYPLSTIFLTTENTDPELQANSPENLADILLQRAWLQDLGIDKALPLISRLTVSVAMVKEEAEPMPDECS